MIHNLLSQEVTYPANYTPSDEQSAKVSVVFDNYDPYSGYGRNPYAMNNNDDIIDNIDFSHSHDMEKEARQFEGRVSTTPVNYDYFEDDYTEV